VSNDSHTAVIKTPMVVKNVKISLDLIGEIQHIDLDYPDVHCCSIEASREFERIFNEDGSVRGYLPGAAETRLVFRRHPLALAHPELLEPPDSGHSPTGNLKDWVPYGKSKGTKT